MAGMSVTGLGVLVLVFVGMLVLVLVVMVVVMVVVVMFLVFLVIGRMATSTIFLARIGHRVHEGHECNGHDQEQRDELDIHLGCF